MTKLNAHQNESNLRCITEHGVETVPEDFIAQAAAWAVAEIERLRAELERRTVLTQDGVRVGPGDVAYLEGLYTWDEQDDGSFGPCYATGEPGERCVLSLGSTHGYEDYTDASRMFSTPEASVEAARAFAAKTNAEDAAREANS